MRTAYVYVRTTGTPALETVQAYLPANYTASEVTEGPNEGHIRIEGEDNAGWTLDGYVIPRLASGWIIAREEES